jgi:hypothetical protein
MDVEKRMNLSLDAIIKEKSKPKGSGGSKRTPAVKGRGKVNIANLRLRVRQTRQKGSVKFCSKISVAHLSKLGSALECLRSFMSCSTCI